jgi:hypothetical protein
MLLAFVAGLLLSNTAVAVLTSAGYTTSSRFRALYIGAGVAAAVFGLWVGGYALLGMADRLPDLQAPITALFGRAAVSPPSRRRLAAVSRAAPGAQGLIPRRTGYGGGGAAGSVTSTRVPAPTRLSRRIVPCWASTRPLAMASPRPLPSSAPRSVPPAR